MHSMATTPDHCTPVAPLYRAGSRAKGGGCVSSVDLLLLTADPQPESVLPALSLLPHSVRPLGPEVSVLMEAGPHDIVVVDARIDLVGARSLCRLLASSGVEVPVVAVVGEGGLVAVTADWGVDEIVLPTAGPAEVDARLRLV